MFLCGPVLNHKTVQSVEVTNRQTRLALLLRDTESEGAMEINKYQPKNKGGKLLWRKAEVDEVGINLLAFQKNISNKIVQEEGHSCYTKNAD